MTRRIALTTVLFAALTSTASADPRNELELGSWARALRSGSANALTDNGIGGGVFGYARALPLSPVPRLSLWAVGRFASGGTTGTMFQTMQTEIGYLQLTAGVRARYRLHRHVVLAAGVDVGAARTDLEVSVLGVNEDGMRDYADLKWGGVTEGSVQLDLLAAAHRRFGLGMRLELGYTASSAVPLTPRAADTSAPGTIKLPIDESSLGRLDLGGPFFGFTVFGQF